MLSVALFNARPVTHQTFLPVRIVVHRSVTSFLSTAATVLLQC